MLIYKSVMSNSLHKIDESNDQNYLAFYEFYRIDHM